MESNFDRDFDRARNFDRTRTFINVVGILTMVGAVVGIIASIVFGIMVVSNPEIIGEFFGKIVSGFNQAQ